MFKTKIITFSGKGGVGKTSLAAAAVRILAELHPEKRILAIDADPAVGLSTALGIEVHKTIDDIRREIIASVDEHDNRTALELLGEAKYHIFDAMEEGDAYSFLAVGRPEGAGCYCKINFYLKDVITVLSQEFDYVVIDGEAGIEQISRRVMEKVTHLFLVTDQSKKGCQVIQTIKQVADEMVMYEKLGVIVNRITSPEVKDYIDVGELPALAWIPDDRQITEMDMRGKDIFTLSGGSFVLKGMRDALEKTGVL